MRALLTAEAERAGAQARRLAETGGNGDGPDNLWMAGILDDAGRDARSHEPGPLLDVALVGAIRKAKAAEIVSGETALALARADGQSAIEAAVAADRAEAIDTDGALRELLVALAT